MRYQIKELIATGSGGEVFSGVDSETGCLVAVKKPVAAHGYDGVELSVLREVKLLKELRELKCPNIINLLDVFVGSGDVCLVFEHAPHNLSQVIASPKIRLDPPNVKHISHQLLSGVAFLHSQLVMHRDIKPDNVLLSAEGVVKICDFGLSKSLTHGITQTDTPEVVTVWYRPPELLFGSYKYGEVIDCWSVGCVVAELLTRVALFPAPSELEVLSLIAAVFSLEWEGAHNLPCFIKFKSAPETTLSDLMPSAPPQFLSLVEELLEPNPSLRISASAALSHSYFIEDPGPEPISASDLGTL
eukprot:TRINITY_DN14245_c0_g1_i1.p1 TRINITY_DN14245_c0_g1~~TRINITY_DN14245_c0_g1_i1.p1  ORF type:complete len:301 (+),score=45.69 TRINITY_DN14245_c0_g1_i1:71-973(+)